MSIASIPTKFDENSPAVKQFLEPRGKADNRKDMLQKLRADLSDAFESPDRVAPAEAKRPAPAPVQPSEPPAQPQPSAEVAPAAAQDAKGKQTRQRPARPPAPDTVAVETKRSLEKTYSVDPEKHELMVMFSNLEGLRLRQNVSTSRILDHLLAFALSHVDLSRGEVIPTVDGRGLHIHPDKEG